MRFLSSVAFLSLAGLGLTSPMHSGTAKRNDAGASSALTGARALSLAAAVRARDEAKDDNEVKAAALRQRQDDLFCDLLGLCERGEGEYGGHGQGGWDGARYPYCLRDEDVNGLVDAYVRMLSHWDDADAKYLADSFSDWSDSINILAGLPLGGATFPTKQAFIDHQHTQPDNLPLVVTHKSPYSCNEIALIWQATFGVAQKQVRGVTIIEATKEEKGYWQIKKLDVEFNNIAYLLDIGGSFKFPGQ